MYVCGITPYDDTHLGHARCYVVFDTLKRYLQYSGYDVEYIQNITDIDDKIIKKSRHASIPPTEVARKYFDKFIKNMEELNVLPADKYPKVSETIDDIIKFIEELLRKGMAYERGTDIYFRVTKSSGYGNLSGRRSRTENCKTVNLAPKAPKDFALWKSDSEFGWDSPWGKGRPGWHIECSAISRKFFGDTFDVHGGGLDLLFPHHENERAQNIALTSKEPVKYWIHNGMVTLKGDKMAKSTGNFFLLDELFKKFSPSVIRMYLLTVNYRQVLDFTWTGLKDVQKAYNKLREFKKEIKEVAPVNGEFKKCEDEIISALNDDFNTARAIGEIFKKINPIMERMFSGKVSIDDIKEGKRLIKIFEEVLGVLLKIDVETSEDEIKLLIEQRQQYRKQKKYSEADKIRDRLTEMGIVLKDTPAGSKWHRVF